MSRVWVLAGLFFVGYATWSVVLYHEYQSTGYDLGIFEQAVRSYAGGHWPTSDLKAPGFPLLGDHFSPILAVLVPFYLLHPSATTLLVAQAFLLAVSVVPVTRLAVGVVGLRRGLLLGTAYGLSWGLLHAVRFDFHEICFAVPLLAFGLERLVLRQWRAAVWWTLPLVLVKEDLPWTVVAVGLYLVLRRQRRLGLLVALFGVCVGVAVVLVVLPSLNPGGRYAYWSALDQHGSVWVGLAVRLGTVVFLLAPSGFLAVRSPVVLVGLPSLALRFVSGNAVYWGMNFHYNAVLMPVLFVAFVDVLRRVASWTRFLVPLCLVVAVGLAVPVLVRGNGQPVWTGQQAAAADGVLAEIPDGASVAASNRLAPHLTGRCRVFLFPWRPGGGVLPDWVAVALPSAGWPVSGVAEGNRVRDLAGLGYRLVVSTGNVKLFERG